MYDLIGDIHGHADELEQLLAALGYRNAHGAYGHPERRVIFLGDFIDRGPKIRQVLEIVRPMVEEGKALAVMGNHELNALAYHTEDPEKPGEYLRRRTPKNQKQHRHTLEQLNPKELSSHLEWFRTLPMWLDLDGLRAVHACWDERAMAKIATGLEEQGGITPAFLQSACHGEKPLFGPVEVILKGKEAKLPAGISFQDKEGHVRTAIRTRLVLVAARADLPELRSPVPRDSVRFAARGVGDRGGRSLSRNRQAGVRRALLALGTTPHGPCRQRGLSRF